MELGSWQRMGRGQVEAQGLGEQQGLGDGNQDPTPSSGRTSVRSFLPSASRLHLRTVLWQQTQRD